MAYYIDGAALTAIANQIRTKLNSNSNFTPEQMEVAIRENLRYPIEEILVTADGTYDVSASKLLRVMTEAIEGGQLSYDYDEATMMMIVTEHSTKEKGTGTIVYSWNDTARQLDLVQTSDKGTDTFEHDWYVGSMTATTSYEED